MSAGSTPAEGRASGPQLDPSAPASPLPGPVLHLYANHKVTGPAELALEAARALLSRGVDARFASSDVRRTRHRDRWLHLLARERGVPTADLAGVTLRKHVSPVRAFFDVRRLAAHLRADPPALVHCHLPADHLIAGYAVARSGHPLPIVRSLYDGEPPPPSYRTRLTFGRMTRLLLCHSADVADQVRARAAEYGLAPERVRFLAPPIDTDRFDPARGVAPRRAALGIPEDAFVLGIVARMQTHRRFELLLEGIGAALADVPDLHVVVVGRGTNQEAVAREPVARMGLTGRVHFSGYVSGEDYVGTLAAFDAKVYLVPGSDGTCRAVREALAMGVPVIATRRGMLPELVREGEDGLLIDEEPAALAGAIAALARDPERRARLRQTARRGAVERFAFAEFAARLDALYREALDPA